MLAERCLLRDEQIAAWSGRLWLLVVKSPWQLQCGHPAGSSISKLLRPP